MTRLKPVITEKSTLLAKSGKYTFVVDTKATKYEIKRLVSKAFGVTVLGVRTMKKGGKTVGLVSRRKKRYIAPVKKAVVWLAGKDKIDIFETKKSK